MSGAPPEIAEPAPKRSIGLGIAVAALAMIAVIGWAIAWRATRPVDHPLTRLSVDLGPEAMTGINLTVAISPDGWRLVFPARGPDGKQLLAMRLLNQAQPTLLPGMENGADPFFSPDGQWIGFFSGNQLTLRAVLLLHPILGRNEDAASSGPSVPASRLGLEAVEPGMALRYMGTLFGVPSMVSAMGLGSRSGGIGPISLDAKCAGARSAGNPHATCEVAGGGNRLTVRLVRHSQRKREQWIGRTYGALAPVLDPTGIRAPNITPWNI